jgi:RNA-dependent RNA polymerase
MEIELKNVDFDANIYDIYEAMEQVLHGPELYDPNDRKNRGRKPRFEVILGVSPARRIHNGTATLLVPVRVGKRLLRWYWDSPEIEIIVKDRELLLFDACSKVSPEVAYRLEKALYVDHRKEQLRRTLEYTARQFRLRIANVQFGVWFTQPDPLPNQARSFSVEYDREYLTQSAAYINLVYEDSLFCIDVSATPL